VAKSKLTFSSSHPCGKLTMASLPKAGSKRIHGANVTFTPGGKNVFQVFGAMTASGWIVVSLESKDRISDGFTGGLKKAVETKASSNQRQVINRACDRKNRQTNQVATSPKKEYNGKQVAFPRLYFLVQPKNGREIPFDNPEMSNKQQVRRACDYVFKVSTSGFQDRCWGCQF
jgi:hypothetical protein